MPKRSTLAADLLCLQTCDDRGNYSFRFYYHHSALENFFLEVRLLDTLFSARFQLMVATCDKTSNFWTLFEQWWLERMTNQVHRWLDRRLPEGTSASDFRFTVVFHVFRSHEVASIGGNKLLPEIPVYQKNQRGMWCNRAFGTREQPQTNLWWICEHTSRHQHFNCVFAKLTMAIS